MAHSTTIGSDTQATSSELSLEHVLAFIRRLDPVARSRVAQALADCEMDARLEQLIRRLAGKQPVDDISDTEIQTEIDAVRRTHAGESC